MADQAEGLRHKHLGTRIVSVVAMPDQHSTAIRSASGLAKAWQQLGASPLLIDCEGDSLTAMTGCHPLHGYVSDGTLRFSDMVLRQDSLAALLARSIRGGERRIVDEARMAGFSTLLFCGMELSSGEIPIDERTAQDIFLVASEAGIESAYALLKALCLANSPARLWLPWTSGSEAGGRLRELALARLDRTPFLLDETSLSYSGHAFARNSLSMSLQHNDFLGIVTRMDSKQSVRGEETPSNTKRHA